MGQLQYSDWSFESLFFVLPAVCHFFNRLNEELPDAEKVFIMNNGFKTAIVKGIRKACEHYGIKLIELDNTVDKENGHPTEKGMEDIKNQVRDALESF